MSEQAAPEPTMEEILASIRRIISEDDAPAAEAEAEAAPETPHLAAVPAPEPEPEPEVEPEPVVEAQAEDVLELTQRVEPPPAETVGDLDVYTKAEPELKPVPQPSPQVVALVAGDDDEELVGESTAFAAASAFGNLTSSIPLPAPGRTLEDLTRELLRPLLKAWLDENLPRIVESKVAEEVERISRTRVR
jgi:cell pole-organizing protein PopZ